MSILLSQKQKNTVLIFFCKWSVNVSKSIAINKLVLYLNILVCGHFIIAQHVENQSYCVFILSTLLLTCCGIQTASRMMNDSMRRLHLRKALTFFCDRLILNELLLFIIKLREKGEYNVATRL